MTFPETRLTLIHRLAAGGSEDDWRRFVEDYWGPVCRFALRFGAGELDTAEDVTSETFQVLWEKQLLIRWTANRSAKLRTLLCSVVRNILSNRGRVQAGRQRLDQQWLDQLPRDEAPGSEGADGFYAAWAEDLVQQAVEALATEYYRQNRGDYVRVLYGRLCEGLSVEEVAQGLSIKPTDVVNYFRHARQRLAERLEDRLRRQVGRYVPNEESETEFTREWEALRAHLAQTGGLEEAVRRAYELLDPVRLEQLRTASLTRLTSLICSKGGKPLHRGGGLKIED
jgi:RNA polymerase sigma factor (sigma-70 family)